MRIALHRFGAQLDQAALLQSTQRRVLQRGLAQEIGREINTTGAKANDAALQALVVDAKVALDQLREQAANLA